MAPDITQVIEEKKQLEEQLKQEHKREAEKKEEAKPESAKKAEVKEEKKKEDKKEAKEKKEKEQKPILERVVAINLRRAYAKPKNHRARIAVSLVRQYVDRHFKAAGKLKIAEGVNSAISKHGGMRPPKKIRVLVQKFEDGTVKAGLPKA